MPDIAEVKDERYDIKPYSLSNKSDWYTSSESEDESIPYHDLVCHYGVAGISYYYILSITYMIN